MIDTIYIQILFISTFLIFVAQKTMPRYKSWLEDLQFLVKNLSEKHIAPFHHTSQKTFQNKVESLKLTIPSLQPHQIVVKMMELTANIGDGHTTLYPPAHFQRLPLNFFWFGEKLYITRTNYKHQNSLGCQVVGIYNYSIEEVFERLKNIIPQHENQYYQKAVSQYLLTFPEILHTLGVIPSTRKVRLVCQNAQDKQFLKDVASISSKTYQKTIHWKWAMKPLPLFMQELGNPHKRLWYRPLDKGVLYVNFQLPPGWETLKHTLQQIKRQVQYYKKHKLILDLRLYEGGEEQKIYHLASQLVSLESMQEVYVVVGRYTFASAISCALFLQKKLNACLVGEPTGGSPNTYHERKVFQLPHSKLMASYSTRYEKLVEKDVRSIFPEKIIFPDWDLYKAGKDPVLDWIIQKGSSKKI